MIEGKLSVTKQFKFDSSHFLPGHNKCGQMHGHTYHMEVELEGSIAENGMIMDFAQVKSKIQPYVDVLDHKTLNSVKGLEIPTAENIVLWFVEQIERTYPDNLVRVRVWEGDGSYAEWKRSHNGGSPVDLDKLSDRIANMASDRIAASMTRDIVKR